MDWALREKEKTRKGKERKEKIRKRKRKRKKEHKYVNRIQLSTQTTATELIGILFILPFFFLIRLFSIS